MHYPKSWPFEEAQRILHRIQNHCPEKGYVLFETGYGPSGLPHIGTFGEVARTSMVQHAFSQISTIPSRLFAFSDDMDGLRKVPDNVPNGEMLKQHLGKPLTKIPDPFGCCESFGHHNNAMLRRFLDSFGFEYEFQSATELYTNGIFDCMLCRVLENYDEIMGVLLPTLRDERRATYSPFLPVCPRTGVVLQVPMVEVSPLSQTVIYRDVETQKLVEIPVVKGNCKLQWKVDWGMRWCALDVDYEMSGKDLIDSVKISSKVCRVLGGRPPENLTYEHFLDQNGEKISKSKGNGLTIDEWLTYAPKESLSYFMYQAPKRAKRLYFDVIPRSVDEYIHWRTIYKTQGHEEQKDNSAYHIHAGHPPSEESSLSFTLLLNLVSACNSEDANMLWGFVKRYNPLADPATHPFLDQLIHHAVRYYQDFIKPSKVYRKPTEEEKAALLDLAESLENISSDASAEEIQGCVFTVGKKYNYTDLRQWFLTLYELLLGQKEGPRMGSFIQLYGPQNMRMLIHKTIF